MLIILYYLSFNHCFVVKATAIKHTTPANSTLSTQFLFLSSWILVSVLFSFKSYPFPTTTKSSSFDGGIRNFSSGCWICLGAVGTDLLASLSWTRSAGGLNCRSSGSTIFFFEWFFYYTGGFKGLSSGLGWTGALITLEAYFGISSTLIEDSWGSF